MLYKKTALNIVYKTLVFKWLNYDFCPHRRLCRWIGTKAAIPNVSYTQPLAIIITTQTNLLT